MVNTLDQLRLLVVIRLRLLLLTKCEDRPSTCSPGLGFFDTIQKYCVIVGLPDRARQRHDPATEVLRPEPSSIG